MGTRDHAEFFRARDADEAHEVAQITFVGFARARVVDVGEPLDFRRDVSEPLELSGGQCALPGIWRELMSRKLRRPPPKILLYIKYVMYIKYRRRASQDV